MSIGFKEWTLICEALGGGTQSLILRKGGIAEGRAGFHFKHEEFLLMPTLFHEQAARLKLPAETPLPAPRADGQLAIHLHARVEWAREITDWAQIERLDPFHLWRREIVEERFKYDGKEALNVAFVRIARLSRPLVFPDAPRYGGCRSWVEFPEPEPGTELVPVLSDIEHKARAEALHNALGA